jgi:cytochrome b561
MNEIVARPPRGVKTARARYLLALDAGMLALVCVLEALSLTGLAWHEWLGFLLCLLVLLHVILQWPWFVTAFRRLFARGPHLARVKPVLNYLLFIVMVAVLVSGVLISNQIAPLTGNTLGRPRVWSELHSWLNFTLVALVGVHLAMSWDWVLGVMRRRTVPLARMPAPAKILWRGAIVLFAACLVAAVAYLAVAAMLKPTPREKRPTVQTAGANQTPQPRKGRPQSFRSGLQELDIAVLVVIFVVIVGRYAPRIRL